MALCYVMMAQGQIYERMHLKVSPKHRDLSYKINSLDPLYIRPKIRNYYNCHLPYHLLGVASLVGLEGSVVPVMSPIASKACA